MPGHETIEFRHEFVRETFGLLRRRLRNFVLLVGPLWLLARGFEWFVRVRAGIGDGWTAWGKATGLFASDVLMIGAFAWAMFVGLDKGSSRNLALYTSLGLVSFFGLHLVVSNYVLDPYIAPLLVFAAVHLLASVLMPWTGVQALIPLAAYVVFRSIAMFADGQGDIGTDLLSVVVGCLVGIPGSFICTVRHEMRQNQFGYRALSTRYGVLRSELASARKIHEALFPAPVLDGDIRLTYRYEPMRHIGGDYLHVARTPQPAGSHLVSLVLVDVTGHGIPAALTVNRLHGELELLFAADPSIDPGSVLKHLNRYVHLTLAKHSVYATALCLRFNPVTSNLEVANGGHPPAFLRGIDGTIDEIGSTAYVLGACRDDEFDPGMRTCPFHAGDTLIAYTDGVTEARAPDGRMLRIDGFRSLIATSKCHPGSWPDVLLRAVTDHRGGAPTEDDTLVVEIHRMLRSDTRSGRIESVAEPLAPATL